MLGRYDTTLKKIFAWYASLPNLAGPVSWERFRNNHKGMLSGHLLLLLTDFKVALHLCCPCTISNSTFNVDNAWCGTFRCSRFLPTTDASLKAHLLRQAFSHLANCLYMKPCVKLCAYSTVTCAFRLFITLVGNGGRCRLYRVCYLSGR